jgi:DNA repair protein RecO (recombination protein O)
MSLPETTRGIVLRVAPFSQTSQIVTWLTVDAGRLTTLVKGARRPRSWFLGQYDLFYTCELLYYPRIRAQVCIARECSPLNTRPSLRSDWRGMAAASYACDLLARVSVPGDTGPSLFRLAETLLDYLCGGQASVLPLLWFELALAIESGFAPQFSRCAGCRADLAAETRLAFSPRAGGTLCTACAGRTADRPAVLPSGILRVLRSLQACPSPTGLSGVDCPANRVVAVGRLLGVFLTFHLDVPTASRRIAMGMLQAHG